MGTSIAFGYEYKSLNVPTCSHLITDFAIFMCEQCELQCLALQ